MKGKTFFLFVIIGIFLFSVAGFFYARTSKLEKEKELLNSAIQKEVMRNRDLKAKYYETFNPDRIYSYATEKLKMVPPSSYVITEINNGE